MATAVKPRIKLDKKEAKKGDIVEVKALVAHIMETGQRKDAQGNTIPRKILKQVHLHGRRQAGVRRRLRAGGVGEPVHPVQVQGDGVRSRGADLDRRRRLHHRRRGEDHGDVTRMFSRREFLQVAAATAALVPPGWTRAFAQQSLTQDELLRFDATRQRHAAAFRRPARAASAGAFPRAVDQSRRRRGARRGSRTSPAAIFSRASASRRRRRAAYALTSEDFAALAQSYGRIGGLDRLATVVEGGARGARRQGAAARRRRHLAGLARARTARAGRTWSTASSC